MTMPLPGEAFAFGVPLRTGPTSTDASSARGRVLAVAVTVALHVAVVVALIAGVHAAALKIPATLSVHINPAEHKLDVKIAPPPPQLQKPQIITVPPPEIQIQTASSPIAVQQQPIAAPPPAATAGVPKATGEGKEGFLGRLLAQFNRFKQYPRAARQAHIQGVVMLHFVMDANGAVLSAEISKGSGYAVLDAEALALIRRAQPLPALPADFPTRTLDAVVPIEFALDR